MENKYLKLKINLIKNLEKENEERKINDELIQNLWELIRKDYDTYVIRKEYKRILEEINKYDRNYYGLICIILNVMVSKKEILKMYDTPIKFKDLKTMKQRIAGEIQTGNTSIIKYTTKIVEYDYINYPEGIGEKETVEHRKKLLRQAEEILNEEKLDLEKAKKWLENYKKYIIMTYGRWSKQYEKYMNTAFEMQIILTSPNILLLAMRETMRKGIKSSINELSIERKGEEDGI